MCTKSPTLGDVHMQSSAIHKREPHADYNLRGLFEALESLKLTQYFFNIFYTQATEQKEKPKPLLDPRLVGMVTAELLPSGWYFNKVRACA